MKKQKSKIKIIILILITFMISLIPTVVQAGKTDKLINLPTKESNKREVVFSKLNLNGNVKGIYIVNHFHPKEKINLVDYGEYSEVIHLIGLNTPIIKEDKILIDNVEGPYYYQGNLVNQELPWKFNIIWNHNGEIKSPQELSGVYGKVKLEINIAQNEKIDNHFFDHYALQISIPINPEKAHVEAASEGFTLAYTGSKQQITYMVLPGLETTIKIILDVENFSMDQITITGVPLSIDFDINSFGDIAEMLSPLKELENGVAQFADGSLELQKGYEELLNACKRLQGAGKELISGGKLLASGVTDLKNGSKEYSSGVNQYMNVITQLSNGYKEFNNGLQTIYQGTKQLNEESTNLKNGSQTILDGLNEIVSQLPENLDLNIPEITPEMLTQLDQLIEGSEQIKNSLEELAKENGGLDLLHKGLTQIKNNLIDLKTQADQFIVPDQDVAPKDANTWKNEMVAMGFSFNGDPAIEVMFYNQLEAMSNLASNYKPAVLMLQGTINGLLDQTNGIPALEYGAGQILDGAKQLSFGYNGTEQNPGLHDSIVQLVNQVKNLANSTEDLTPFLDNYPTLISGLREIRNGYIEFDDGLNAYLDGADQIIAGYEGTDEQIGLLAGSQNIKNGLEVLLNNGDKLKTGGNDLNKGIDEIANGLGLYVNGIDQFNNGLNQYCNEGLFPFKNGLNEYKLGGEKLKTETNNLPNKFEEALREKIEELGKSFEVKSFVSDKNKNISSVQFIIMAEEIPGKE